MIKKIHNILVPKDDDLIMGQLMETHIENLPTVIKIYDKIKDFNDCFEHILEVVEEHEGEMYHLQSSGLLGLKRALESGKLNRMKPHNVQWNVDGWIAWVFTGLAEFKIEAKRFYKDYEVS